jgi:ribosomal protein L11 methyltransferase
LEISNPPDAAFDTLVELGALDIELVTGGLAALMPDSLPAGDVADALGGIEVRTSRAIGRDDESVWTLSRRPVRIRTLSIVPAELPANSDALRLIDGSAFGTGLHATTALCLEAIEDLLDALTPDRMLDVGTGSGVLALAALRRGVRRAIGLDLDPEALRIAAVNARLNGYGDRLSLLRGGPDALTGSCPLVVANIRAAELMAMAPTLAQRVASRGRLVLSGIAESVAPDVEGTYRRLGMTIVGHTSRDGWTALMFHPSW